VRFWAAALLVPLTAYGLLGWFSRYASDDYCTAGITATQGFLNAQAYWYVVWSGRYTFTAVVSALEVLGSWVVPVLPAVTLVVWLGVTMWAFLPVACLAGWREKRLASFVLAEVLVFGTLVAAPNIGQSFYMQAGMATYTLPLILIALYAGWVVRKVLAVDRSAPSIPMIVSSGLAMLVIGGLNETTASLYTACLGLAGLLGLLGLRGARRRILVSLMVAGVVGLLAATVLMAIAPGTKMRLAQEGDPGFSLARVPLAWGVSVSLAVAVARRFEALSRPEFVFAFVLPLALGWYGAPNRAFASASQTAQAVLRAGVVAVSIGAVGLGLMALSLFPSYVVQGFDPPARIQQITDFVLVLALAGAGVTAGHVLGRWSSTWRLLSTVRLGVGVALGVLALVPLRDALSIASQVPVEAAYAAAWDRDDQLLRAAAQGETSGPVIAAPLPPRWDWSFIDQGPNDFPNVCVARYYGLPAVVASGPAPPWTGATEPGGRAPGAPSGHGPGG
jgi:hypothetical protein